MKTCSRCKEKKDFDQFYFCRSSKDGFRYQCKKCNLEGTMSARKKNPESAKRAKQKYYSSEKGRAQKKKEDAAFTLSGGRARYEAKRASQPISEARKSYKLAYQLMRSSSERGLSEIDSFVLSEAVKLRRLRERMTGVKWHVDHIVPVSFGGDSSHTNIQVVPALWNRQKSNKRINRFFPI